MNSCKGSVCLLLAILPFAAVALALDAPKLTFKFTTVQVKNAQDTRVYGVNNAGVMVGQYIDSAGVAHGMTLVGNKVTTLDDPSGSSTFCYAIN